MTENRLRKTIEQAIKENYLTGAFKLEETHVDGNITEYCLSYRLDSGATVAFRIMVSIYGSVVVKNHRTGEYMTNQSKYYRSVINVFRCLFDDIDNNKRQWEDLAEPQPEQETEPEQEQEQETEPEQEQETEPEQEQEIIVNTLEHDININYDVDENDYFADYGFLMEIKTPHMVKVVNLDVWLVKKGLKYYITGHYNDSTIHKTSTGDFKKAIKELCDDAVRARSLREV